MKKFTYVEWIAVAVALGVAIVVFAPSFVSFFTLGSVNGSDTNISNNQTLTGDASTTNNTNQTQQQMENISKTDGLEVYDEQVGTGAEVKSGSKVTVHYVGALTDGTVFDTSLKNNTPFTFTVGEGSVIKGWDLGLVGMKEGGVRKLVIAPNLAYGANAVGPIPANSTLVFEVQLLKAE